MEQKKFQVISKYTPSGDQPVAIDQLVENLNNGVHEQVLLGATGTGKTCARSGRTSASTGRCCSPWTAARTPSSRPATGRT